MRKTHSGYERSTERRIEALRPRILRTLQTRRTEAGAPYIPPALLRRFEMTPARTSVPTARVASSKPWSFDLVSSSGAKWIFRSIISTNISTECSAGHCRMARRPLGVILSTSTVIVGFPASRGQKTLPPATYSSSMSEASVRRNGSLPLHSESISEVAVCGFDDSKSASFSRMGNAIVVQVSVTMCTSYVRGNCDSPHPNSKMAADSVGNETDRN